MSDFLAYYGRFAARLWRDSAQWARDNIVWAAALFVVLTLLSAYLHQGFVGWEVFRIDLYAFVMVLLFYLLVHVIRTPWKLDKERQSQREQLQARIAEQNRMVEELNQPPNRPQLSFVRYSEPAQGYKSGFVLRNHGGVAVEICVERFRLRQVWINGYTLSEIGSNAEGLASIWLEASKFDQFSLDDLLTMAQAELPLGQPLNVSLSVVYRDFENRWYRTECDLRFAEHKGEFGPSRQICFGRTRPERGANLLGSKHGLSDLQTSRE